MNSPSQTVLNSGLADPSHLPPLDAEGGTTINVVIETPKGSRNKYAFDAERKIFQLKRVLPVGMAFPYDFGFIPSTKAEDGDPVDVLVLMASLSGLPFKVSSDRCDRRRAR
jgi:inorganic pyrophosphatase